MKQDEEDMYPTTLGHTIKVCWFTLNSFYLHVRFVITSSKRFVLHVRVVITSSKRYVVETIKLSTFGFCFRSLCEIQKHGDLDLFEYLFYLIFFYICFSCSLSFGRLEQKGEFTFCYSYYESTHMLKLLSAGLSPSCMFYLSIFLFTGVFLC